MAARPVDNGRPVPADKRTFRRRLGRHRLHRWAARSISWLSSAYLGLTHQSRLQGIRDCKSWRSFHGTPQSPAV